MLIYKLAGVGNKGYGHWKVCQGDVLPVPGSLCRLSNSLAHRIYKENLVSVKQEQFWEMEHPFGTSAEHLLLFGCKGGLGAKKHQSWLSGEAELDGHRLEYP